jgi:hypothetical protein
VIEFFCVALGGAIGAAVAIGWLSQHESHWVLVARISVVCALMGAFVAVVPHPSGAVAVFIGYGLLSTLATSISVLLPLPRLQHFSDIRQLAKRMIVSLVIITFYGSLFAIIGNMCVQAFFHLSLAAAWG